MRRWVTRIVLLLTVLAFVDYFAYPFGDYVGGKSTNQGRNGLWLRYTWYFGQYDQADVLQLSKRLSENQIRYAYFHVRSLDSNGCLKYRYPTAAKLMRVVHSAVPNIRLLAWVYVDGSTNLRDPTVRRNAVDQAQWLVKTCGFDGVQWDYEPCNDGDAGMLDLLTETKKAIPEGIESVASPPLFPWPFGSQGWSESYYREIGQRCDQIVVMCYDTGFVLPRSYEWLVRRQAELIPRAARCEVLLGLPTYERGGPSHNPRAENLKIALKACRNSRGFSGVSLFADYTTDSSEWSWFQRAWLTNR